MKTELENSEIYSLCEKIRLIHLKYARVNLALVDIKEAEEKTSIFKKIIEEKRWGDLFLNEDWLDLLGMTVRLSRLYKNKEWEKNLRRIFDFFPEETNKIIFQ